MHGIGEIKAMNKRPEDAYRVQRDIFRRALVKISERVDAGITLRAFIEAELARGDKKEPRE